MAEKKIEIEKGIYHVPEKHVLNNSHEWKALDFFKNYLLVSGLADRYGWYARKHDAIEGGLYF